MIRRGAPLVLGALLFSASVLGQSCEVQVFFATPTSGDAAVTILLESIDGARRTVEVAVASFTDDRLGDALVRAHRRGVDVRVLLAQGSEAAIGSQGGKLTSAGIPVRLSSGSVVFCLRFAVVDQQTVLTGSYEWVNLTTAGTYAGLLRITCPLSSQTTVQSYLAEFERLWKSSSSTDATSGTWASAISSVGILSVDPTAQCVYLLNDSDREVDLFDWSISDLEGQYTFPAGTTIPPGDPYRICSDVFNPTQDMTGLYFDPENDELFLITPEGDIIDEAVW